MKRLKSLLCALALTLAFSVPVFAGNMPIVGYCDSAECVQENSAAGGGVWVQIAEGLWQLMASV